MASIVCSTASNLFTIIVKVFGSLKWDNILWTYSFLPMTNITEPLSDGRMTMSFHFSIFCNSFLDSSSKLSGTVVFFCFARAPVKLCQYITLSSHFLMIQLAWFLFCPQVYLLTIKFVHLCYCLHWLWDAYVNTNAISICRRNVKYPI